MEVIVLTEETIDLVSERTGRTTEKLIEELFLAQERGTTVHYYFDLPEIPEE